MADAPLLVSRIGAVERVAANVSIALTHERWKGVLRWDEFRQCVAVLAPPPFLPEDARIPRSTDEWTDIDTTRTVHMLGRMHGLHVHPTMVDDAVVNAARAAPYHPVQEWMGGLTWDGERRVARLFSIYFGAADTPYHRGIARCWMVSAVARTYRPGCQCDYLIVLQGAQGVGKTSALRALIGAPWFSETPLDLGSKDAVLALRGKVCVCFDELHTKTPGQIEKLKNFLTRTSDDVRPPYGRRTIQLPRRLVFAATTNEETPLTDGTGNRRFWPVQCGEVDVPRLASDRAQLWAEAVAVYQRGAKWHPGQDLGRLCISAQLGATQQHPWEETILTWLAGHQGLVARRRGITAGEILAECLGIPSAAWTGAGGRMAADILRRAGYTRRQVRVGARREWRYQPVGMLRAVAAVTDGDENSEPIQPCTHVTTSTIK